MEPEPPKISDIYKKIITSNQTSNAVAKITKQTKHRRDEYEEQNSFEHHSPIHKVHKLDDAESQEIPIRFQDLHCNFNEIDFDVESFLKELSAPTTILDSTADEVSSSVLCSASSIKIDKTLAELMCICDAPIKKTTVEEYEIIEKDIQKISDELKEAAKPSIFVNVSNTFEKSEDILTENLKMLYNSLIFKNYDFSKGEFNPKPATILYEQLYKVNVYISKAHTQEEFAIYFGFPFYLSIRINVLGEVFIVRKELYKQLETLENIKKKHYYSDNTILNILDVITASKFINIITSNKFVSGFNLLSMLIQTIEMYKINSKKLIFNKVILNFEKFVILYKQVIKNLYRIPILD
jgi:hypothetical protein